MLPVVISVGLVTSSVASNYIWCTKILKGQYPRIAFEPRDVYTLAIMSRTPAYALARACVIACVIACVRTHVRIHAKAYAWTCLRM